MNTLSLDTTRLEKVRWLANKITARCPACAANGNDRKGVHLFINIRTGQFGCAAHPDDPQHRREIFRLVGINTERTPDERRRWHRQRIMEENQQRKIKRVNEELRRKRDSLIAANQWTEVEAGVDSPEQRMEWMQDPRNFLAALFTPHATVWTGDTRDSGDPRYADRWRTVEEWNDAPPETVGPMTSPAIWTPGEISRAAANVVASPYVVLDFDGLDGRAPITPEEHQQHRAASLALVKWIRTKLEWKLAAVLFTGSKSIHAWFHAPPEDALASLKDNAHVLGIDPGLIGRPEHPCRLPGSIHPKTDRISRTIWLQRRDA